MPLLRSIEENLDAICRTPTVHRHVLNQHVKPPDIRPVSYDIKSQLTTRSLQSLIFETEAMHIEDDPYIKGITASNSQAKQKRLQAVADKNTYCQVQMKTFRNRSERAKTEFGTWATDFYIRKVISNFSEAVVGRSEELVGWQDEEKIYLMECLKKVYTRKKTDDELHSPSALTPKVEKLISILLEEHKKSLEQSETKFSALIFVEQRVDATILSEILTRHPKTRGIFQCGTLMGSSNHKSRLGKTIYELIDSRHGTATLTEFKNGTKNIVVGTSVAEEGLDIQACHLVVCFGLPKTIKSFIQMRGRARRSDSTYVLMYSNEDAGIACVSMYQNLEEEMIKAYQDENRELDEKMKFEEDDEVKSRFQVKKTGYVWLCRHHPRIGDSDVPMNPAGLS